MKKLAYLLSAAIMMIAGTACLGCLWAVIDEPKALKEMCD